MTGPPPWMLHLTPTEFLATLALLALWRAPDWGQKIVDLAEAIRDFRHGSRRYKWIWRKDDDVDGTSN
jgi:hypothetical protein